MLINTSGKALHSVSALDHATTRRFLLLQVTRFPLQQSDVDLMSSKDPPTFASVKTLIEGSHV